jgi:opine dehydrogenase
MKDTVKRVAVIGAGNGGITAAADLKQKGFEVSLYEDKMFPENIATIREKGGILLQDESGESFQPIEVVTNNIERAIIDADIIMTTVPAFAIESIAESLIPVVTEKQIVLINGAGSMGRRSFQKTR